MTRQLYKTTSPLEGRGIHSGQPCRLVMAPLTPGSGIWFVRTDLLRRRAARIPALLDHAVPSARRTVLRADGAAVSTPEHLLAALTGLGFSDVELRLSGEEVPAMDGSALPFCRALMEASASAPAHVTVGEAWQVRRMVRLRRGRSLCVITPAPRLEIQAAIELPGVRWPEWQRLRYEPLDPAHFMARIAPARTFGFVNDAALLRARGLARGANLGNVLALTPDGRAINPGGPRLMQEPVRHKVLDTLGDLALLGPQPLKARVRMERGNHALLIGALKQGVAAGDIARISLNN